MSSQITRQILIVYETIDPATGAVSQHFTRIPADNQIADSVTVEAFSDNHPEYIIKGAYRTRDEVISSEKQAMDTFMALCWKYGFRGDQFNAPYQMKKRDGSTATMHFIGFNERNTKYKCVSVDAETGVHYKCSVNQMQQYMSTLSADEKDFEE